ncbi:hypothetical protein [Nonomuraea aridisoli]|uniref:Uncharacterized protein n=1 Tax=Nonomuraea aridisoli TaxID=2070368 RepID=A0A2W2DXZ6_9ACTN|nr:hypothetical protein [Nonomuraea aridisoli]PZG02067.1 hypothetical protein C1J01_47660 [Nonomuraea aridisoli]
MDNTEPGIAGFRLTQHTWPTELGHWIDAIAPDGRRAGALLFDQAVIGLPGVRDRVVGAVMTDRRLVLGGLTGLVPVADMVAAGDQVWLLTAQAVAPTLADLLTSRRVEASGAACVLVETAQTLLALHAAGVTHGSVRPRTIVISAEGAALLSERGLADAVRGRASAPGHDAAGWAALARVLAAPFGASPVAELFERAAATAGAHGLAAARDVLVEGRGVLPGGRISRDGLAQAARDRSAFAQAPAHGMGDEGDVVTRSHIPEGPYGVDEGDIVTLLRVPEGATGPARFGPGVGMREQVGETAAQRIWRSGGQEATLHRRAARRSRARRRRTILATAAFAVIMAGAILAWLRTGDVPELAVTSVDVVAPKRTQGCDSAVVITGTVVTNGAPGEIVYEWRKNLDEDVVRGSLRTRSDRTSYTLPLRWTLRGESDVRATATLRIVTPGPVRTGRASFRYKC